MKPLSHPFDCELMGVSVVLTTASLVDVAQGPKPQELRGKQGAIAASGVWWHPGTSERTQPFLSWVIGINNPFSGLHFILVVKESFGSGYQWTGYQPVTYIYILFPKLLGVLWV